MIEVGYRPAPYGGEVVVARCASDGYACRYEVPVAEVGAAPRLRELARRAAASKALRGVARVATRVVQATPYGRAATAATRIAREATQAARRPRAVRATPRDAMPVRASTLSDAQRVELVRRLLDASSRGLSPVARLAALREVVS